VISFLLSSQFTYCCTACCTATGTRNDPTIILNLTKSGTIAANYESSYDPLVKFVAEQYNIIYFIVTGFILSPIAGYLISHILTRVENI
jgi:hypothetical protein